MTSTNHYRLITDHLSYRIVHVPIWRAVGGIYEGMLLEYLVGWCSSTEEGWAYRTKEEIEEDTLLTRKQQDAARATLEQMGLLITKREGLPARLYYSIAWGALDTLIDSMQMPDLVPIKTDDFGTSSWSEMDQPVSPEGTNRPVPQVPSHNITTLNTSLKTIDAPANADARPPGEKRGARLPDDWRPTDADLAAITSLLLPATELQRQMDIFRDYWRSIPGAKGRKLDWSATWRNWMRRAAADQKQRSPRAGKYSIHDSLADLADAEAREAAARAQ